MAIINGNSLLGLHNTHVSTQCFSFIRLFIHLLTRPCSSSLVPGGWALEVGTLSGHTVPLVCGPLGCMDARALMALQSDGSCRQQGTVSTKFSDKDTDHRTRPWGTPELAPRILTVAQSPAVCSPNVPVSLPELLSVGAPAAFLLHINACHKRRISPRTSRPHVSFLPSFWIGRNQ